jgi:hypothetical protein
MFAVGKIFTSCLDLTGAFALVSIGDLRRTGKRRHCGGHSPVCPEMPDKWRISDAVISGEDIITNDEDAITNDEDAIINDEDAITNDEDAITNDEDAITNDEDAITNDEDAIFNAEDANRRARAVIPKNLYIKFQESAHDHINYELMLRTVTNFMQESQSLKDMIFITAGR